MLLLVTGGAGFIGTHFVRMAAGLADKVLCLDALTYAGKYSVDVPSNVERILANIRDPNHLGAVFKRNPITHVVHLAAETHVDRSIADPEPFIRTNILGTANLLAACRLSPHVVQRMVYVSTDEVYGNRSWGVSHEDDLLRPSSPYSATKAAGEMLCHAERTTFRGNIVITRGTNTYGPGQYPEKLIPLVIDRVMKGLPIPVYGDGRQSRDWLHVEDHCSGIWAALTKGTSGEVYNLGADRCVSNLCIIETITSAIRKLGGPEGRIEHVEDRKGHDARYAVNADKARGELGWAPKVEFDLLPTVMHYMRQ